MIETSDMIRIHRFEVYQLGLLSVYMEDVVQRLERMQRGETEEEEKSRWLMRTKVASSVQMKMAIGEVLIFMFLYYIQSHYTIDFFNLSPGFAHVCLLLKLLLQVELNQNKVHNGLGRHTHTHTHTCLLYTSPSPRDRQKSRMPSSA